MAAVMVSIGFFFGTILGLIAGVSLLWWYMILRVHKNLQKVGGDDSNLTNSIRIVSHVVLHPHDFGKMYYVTDEMIHEMRWAADIVPKRPFWYIDEDEFSGVVKTRPPQ